MEKTLTWSQMQSRMATAPKLELHHVAAGHGPPVLLLHGLGAHGFTWRHLAPALAAHHTTVALDMKGFGDSPKPLDSHYSIYDHTVEVVRFIEERDLRDLTLIGHSFGGGVALVTAACLNERIPRRVSRLVLIDSIGAPQKIPWFIRLLRVPLLPECFGHVVPRTWATRTMLRRAYFDDSKVTADIVAAYARPSQATGARHAIVDSARHVQPEDYESLLQRFRGIHQPALLIWGEHDQFVPHGVGRTLATLLPDAVLKTISHCGHIPHEERPDSVVALITEFIRTH